MSQRGDLGHGRAPGRPLRCGPTMDTTPPPDENPAEPPAPDEAHAPAPAAEPVRAPGRRWGRRRAAAPAEAEPAADAQLADAVPEQPGDVVPQADPPRPPGAGRLRRERRKLLTRREEAVYHLGGLAFELYRRDQLTEDVMRLRAGEVAQLDDTVRDIDVRLGEIERERRDRRTAEPADPAVGCCLVCRTPFRAEARFCWQCGTQVVPPPVGGDDQPTAVISTPDAA